MVTLPGLISRMPGEPARVRETSMRTHGSPGLQKTNFTRFPAVVVYRTMCRYQGTFSTILTVFMLY